MAGALSRSLIFFSSLIAVVIIGLVTLSYAAHGYLAIVEDTGAGSDDIRWPDESITDFLWKPFYLAWVWAVPVVATWLTVLAVAPELLDGPLGVFVVAGGSLWLLFPVFMLSSLTARSRVQVLHLALLLRLVRHTHIVLLFYLLTAPVLAAGLALAYLGLFVSGWAIVPAAPICVGLFFIHARLLGRLAWRIGRARSASKAAEATQQTKANKKRPRRRNKPNASSDPWAIPEEEPYTTEDEEALEAPAVTHIAAGDPRALPTPLPKSDAIKAGLPAAAIEEEEEDEWAPRKKPYALADAEAAPPAPAMDREIDPDDVLAAEPVSLDARPTPEQLYPPDPRFLAPREPPPPRFALFSNIWDFPVRGSSLRPFISLTLLGLLLAFFLRLMLVSRPT